VIELTIGDHKHVAVMPNREHVLMEFVRMKKVHFIPRDSDETLCGYRISARRSREEHTPVTFINKMDYNWNDDVCRTCLAAFL